MLRIISDRVSQTPRSLTYLSQNVVFCFRLEEVNAGHKYCRMLQESILQYFQPPLSYHLSLRPFVSSNFEWPLKTGKYSQHAYWKVRP